MPGINICLHVASSPSSSPPKDRLYFAIKDRLRFAPGRERGLSPAFGTAEGRLFSVILEGLRSYCKGGESAA